MKVMFMDYFGVRKENFYNGTFWKLCGKSKVSFKVDFRIRFMNIFIKSLFMAVGY